nr:unnamed protein product [Callosobruchus analis]CAI5861341.1 unnamed protein product [Callosobruchus analis]
MACFCWSYGSSTGHGRQNYSGNMLLT